MHAIEPRLGFALTPENEPRCQSHALRGGTQCALKAGHTGEHFRITSLGVDGTIHEFVTWRDAEAYPAVVEAGMSATLPTINDMMDQNPNADNVECSWCATGVVERKVDDYDPETGASYEYLNGSARIDGAPVCKLCAGDYAQAEYDAAMSTAASARHEASR